MFDFDRLEFLMERLPTAKDKLYKARARATNTSVILSDMPKGSGSTQTRLERDVEYIITCEQLIDDIEKQISEMRITLEPLIADLKEPFNNVMHCRYILGLSIRKIAAHSPETLYSESYLFEIVRKGKAMINQTPQLPQ